MSFSNYYSINNPYQASGLSFRSNDKLANGILSKPIETVQKVVETSVDTFVPSKDEKTNKKRKKAIAVGSSVVVLSGLVAILNPRFSSKAVVKLKQWQNQAAQKLAQNPNSFVGKIYKASSKFFDKIIQFAQFSNNINSVKDVGFKWFCVEEKSFSGIKNKAFRSFMQKVDKIWRKIITKPYNAITKGFDKIGKHTVKSKYKKAIKQMEELEFIISQHKNKLPIAQQKEIEAKLAEIVQLKKRFNAENLATRFAEQESKMSSLERDIKNKYRSYKRGFRNGYNSNHFNNNLSFWAEDMLMSSRNKLEQKGLVEIEKLIGDSAQKGKYNEILDIMLPYMNVEDKLLIETALQKTRKGLYKANHSECVEYFDKKRDLTLGSAPTDILTALVGLTASGIAISTAHDKDEKTSRLLTGVLPVVAGLGASMAFTAMLFSGVKGMLYGGLTGLGLNFVGSKVDETRLKRKQYLANNKEALNNSFAKDKIIQQGVNHA